jgi:hypothetical protein
VNTFKKNNSLLIGRKRRSLNWRFVGPSYWPDYQASIQQTASTTTVADILTTPAGAYPSNGAFIGGVLLPDGRVFCVPHNSTTARIYGGGGGFDINVVLSAYYNKL